MISTVKYGIKLPEQNLRIPGEHPVEHIVFHVGFQPAEIGHIVVLPVTDKEAKIPGQVDVSDPVPVVGHTIMRHSV